MNNETTIETPCDECGAIHDRDNENMSWSEVAELTHAIHVCRFGGCFCEEGERQYDDCPVAETYEYVVRVRVTCEDTSEYVSGDKLGDLLGAHTWGMNEYFGIVVEAVSVAPGIEVSS